MYLFFSQVKMEEESNPSPIKQAMIEEESNPYPLKQVAMEEESNPIPHKQDMVEDESNANTIPLKMEQSSKPYINSQWLATSIFDFYYFCCPECNEKSQDKQEFINHASTYHAGVSWKHRCCRVFSGLVV